jgi:hypothetical protein
MDGYPGYVLDAKFYSVQKIAELILGITAVVLVSILTVGAIYIIISCSLKFNIWHKIFSGLMIVYSLIFMIFVFLPLSKPLAKKKK